MTSVESLQPLLERYVPRDADETHELAKFKALLSRGEPAFQRSHFIPGHFTASAFVTSPDRRDLLLIHHRKLQRWLQPGGHFEQDDPNPLAAALREVEEEVGIEPSRLEVADELFDIDIHRIPANPKEPTHHHFDLRFLFVGRSREFVRGDEVADARWWPLEKIREADHDRSLQRAVGKLF
ncbi:MAG: NUDIX hydrolase [Myxococcota bacterium]